MLLKRNLTMPKQIKVAARSEAPLVAGAIVGILREQSEVHVQAVGANAVNQAVKAMAIARSYLAADNTDLYARPSFVTILIKGRNCSAIRFHVCAVQGALPNTDLGLGNTPRPR